MSQLAFRVLVFALFCFQAASAAPLRQQVSFGRDAEHYQLPLPSSPTISIQNSLGNIRVYPASGSEIELSVDGLRFAEVAQLRVWEPRPGNIIVGIEYPKIAIVPPAGQVCDNYTQSSPETGVILKNGYVILGGRSFNRGRTFNVGTAGSVKVNGNFGETTLSVGIPSRTAIAVKVYSSVGDIEVGDIGSAVYAESRVGTVRFLTETICRQLLSSAGDLFSFDEATW